LLNKWWSLGNCGLVKHDTRNSFSSKPETFAAAIYDHLICSKNYDKTFIIVSISHQRDIAHL